MAVTAAAVAVMVVAAAAIAATVAAGLRAVLKVGLPAIGRRPTQLLAAAFAEDLAADPVLPVVLAAQVVLAGAEDLGADPEVQVASGARDDRVAVVLLGHLARTVAPARLQGPVAMRAAASAAAIDGPAGPVPAQALPPFMRRLAAAAGTSPP